MSIDNIFNSLNDVIEFFIDNVFYGLVRTMFLPENRLLLIGFCILLLISLTLFFVNRFLDSADDIENSMLIMSENSRRKKIYEQRKIERSIEFEEQRKVNEGRRKSQQFKRNIDKYGLSYLNDGKKFAEAYFFKFPERYSFHYAGKTYYNDKLLDIYKKNKEYMENQN